MLDSNWMVHRGLLYVTLHVTIQSDRRESDGFQKKKSTR